MPAPGAGRERGPHTITRGHHRTSRGRGVAERGVAAPRVLCNGAATPPAAVPSPSPRPSFPARLASAWSSQNGRDLAASFLPPPLASPTDPCGAVRDCVVDDTDSLVPEARAAPQPHPVAGAAALRGGASSEAASGACGTAFGIQASLGTALGGSSGAPCAARFLRC
eukprot:5472972-Prymnesium_polylepis.2